MVCRMMFCCSVDIKHCVVNGIPLNLSGFVWSGMIVAGKL